MQDGRLIDQVLGAWRVHDRINLGLLQAVPARGLDAVPSASRGRNVAQVFAHMHKVRVAWLQYNAPELVAGVPRFERGASPGRSQLKAALRASGKAVETLMERTLRGDSTIKAFRRQPVR
jgi:uncharacterized damage-inducible protein DinB